MTTLIYFLDSSALVKKYAAEAGSEWIESITAPETDNAIAIAQITVAEVVAALASKYRGRAISAEEFEAAVEDMLRDAYENFTLVEVDQHVVKQAVAVIRRHPLRGYDAVQLACGQVLNKALIASQESPIIFLSADKRLLSAAQAEGLQIEDPETHRL